LKARDNEVRECRLKIEQLISQLNQTRLELKNVESTNKKSAPLSTGDDKKLKSLEEELKRLRLKYDEKVAECNETASLLTKLKVNETKCSFIFSF